MAILHIHAKNTGSSAKSTIVVDLPEEVSPGAITYKTSIINFVSDQDFHTDDDSVTGDKDNIPSNLLGCVYANVGNWIGGHSVNSNIGSGKLPIGVLLTDNVFVKSTTDAGFIRSANTITNYNIDLEVEAIPHRFPISVVANDGSTPINFTGSTRVLGEIESLDLFFEYNKDTEFH